MTFRAGIIGAGGIAGLGILGIHDEEDIGKRKFDASHAGGYEAASDIELVAVSDLDRERLETFGDAWELPEECLYTDLDEMLTTEDLDVISVCTPSYLHHEHVVAAVESAADPDVVWCEKPIASSVSDAEEMIETCDRTDTELVINHSFRFTSEQMQLRSLVQEANIFGDVHSVHAQFRMELLRNATHVLDMLVYLFDARAERVSGHVTGENEAVDSLDAGRRVDDAGGGGFVLLDDGTFTTVDCTVPRDASSMCITITGSKGKAYLNNDDGEWRYWRLEDGEHVEEPLPGIDGAWTWEGSYRGSFVNAANHINEMLHGDAENPSTGEEALLSLEIIIAFYLSEYTGSQIDIPLNRPLRDVEITSW